MLADEPGTVPLQVRPSKLAGSGLFPTAPVRIALALTSLLALQLRNIDESACHTAGQANRAGVQKGWAADDRRRGAGRVVQPAPGL